MVIAIARRAATAVVTLVLSAFFVFFATQALPGDVAEQLLGRNATPEAVATLRERLGLDTNVWLRFVEWLGNAATGDFGVSLVSGNPVAPVVWTAFSHTLIIAVPAIVFGIGLSVLLGVYAGARRGRTADNAISVATLAVMSIPEFVVATVLVLLFAIALPIFPAVVLAGSEATFGELVPAAILPIVTLILAMSAYIVRATRTSVVDGLESEHAISATMKGVAPRRVLWRHVLPTAMLPVLPVIALNVAWLLGGVVVVESVFNYPGLGKLMIDSVSTRDLPVLQAIALLSALVYVSVNLLADLVAMLFDPRQRPSNTRPSKTRPGRAARRVSSPTSTTEVTE